MKAEYVVKHIQEKTIQDTADWIISTAEVNWAQEISKLADDLEKLAFLGVLYNKGQWTEDLFMEINAAIEVYYKCFSDLE